MIISFSWQDLVLAVITVVWVQIQAIIQNIKDLFWFLMHYLNLYIYDDNVRKFHLKGELVKQAYCRQGK